MRRIVPLTLLLLIVSLPCLAGEGDGEGLPDSLRAAEAGFAKAFAADDLDAFSAFIDDDATFLGRTPLLGKKAVVDQWAKLFGATPRPFSWEPRKWAVNPSGTMGMTSGPVFSPEGKQTGTFSSVWKLQPDGSWKIIFDGGGDCPRSAP